MVALGVRTASSLWYLWAAIHFSEFPATTVKSPGLRQVGSRTNNSRPALGRNFPKSRLPRYEELVVF